MPERRDRHVYDFTSGKPFVHPGEGNFNPSFRPRFLTEYVDPLVHAEAQVIKTIQDGREDFIRTSDGNLLFILDGRGITYIADVTSIATKLKKEESFVRKSEIKREIRAGNCEGLRDGDKYLNRDGTYILRVNKKLRMIKNAESPATRFSNN